jgi:ABC-2 type transport system ATP-binding protein
MTNDKIITAQELSKRFGHFTAVDAITFDVHKGEIFGFLGANGAGKTTAMRMLCGLSKPTGGKATVAGFDVYTQNEQIKRTAFILEHLHLENEANKLVGALPLGWKQKLAFSVAIFHEPEIVFLDEPTGGVDPVTRREFWNMIYQAADNGITIFVTTHYMDEAEYCNRVSIMVDGKIEALDTPAELKKIHHSDSMDDVFLKLARKAVRAGD